VALGREVGVALGGGGAAVSMAGAMVAVGGGVGLSANGLGEMGFGLHAAAHSARIRQTITDIEAGWSCQVSGTNLEALGGIFILTLEDQY
jgi:hypothetical protein